MTISADIVGVEAGPMLQEVDARWLMAYAAGIGWLKDGVRAHPVFPACYEWPLALAIRDKTIPSEARVKAVHATHDLVIHRLPVPGDRLCTTARVVAVERRKPGAYVVTRYETRDASGAPVTTTDAGALYLGVETAGSNRDLVEPWPGVQPLNAAARWNVEVPVPRGAAHVYTECSRIWNPIHTDRAVALAVGLPDIILHGTATLAMAVSAVVESEAGGDPTRVKRIRCRFGAMVLMPSTLTVEGVRTASPEGDAVTFRVLTDYGAPAIRDGVLVL
ncbi:MAG: MaoC/PaaZ C-terminal domain-containing protein [Candidatus Rokuibacteriota bacterium]